MVKAVVNVDFGTHGTGFAWTVVSAAHDDPAQRQIFTCDEWPGQPTPYPKTLSCLIIDRDGEVVQWGWEAHREWRARGLPLFQSGHRLKKHFKMSLARSADEKPARRGMALDDAEDSPQRLIVAFLRKFYERVLTELAKHGFTAADIRWCLTVPAIWDDYQKQVMRTAAHEAGFPTEDGRLILALEPEAAAHYARVAGVQSSASDQEGNLTAPGARYMVVDCGGGTVDITAYRNDDDGLMVEIGRAHGDKCGSAYLNKAFEETVLTKRLGGIEEMDRLQVECPTALEDLLDSWERNKLYAKVDVDQPLYLQLATALDRRLSETARTLLTDVQDGVDDHIVVTPDEIRDIFEQVVPGILRLIDDQIAAMIEPEQPANVKPLVLLAGGFAASPYLLQRVTNHLSDRAEVRQVPAPALAVLAGGVHFAYDPQIRARRSKFTYGVELCADFEEGVDPAESLHVTKDGRRFCGWRFDPLTRAGDTIRTGQEVTRVYRPLESDTCGMTVAFFATREPDPRNTSDPGCHEIGSIEVDLTKVMHLPWDERRVRVTMKFGETEIAARANIQSTDIQLDAKLDFTAR